MHGDKVVIYDEQINWLNENQLRSEIEKIQGPKLIGITCLTTTAKRTYELARMIKKIDREMVTILGGIHPTAVPEEALRRSSADIVVRGKGRRP